MQHFLTQGGSRILLSDAPHSPRRIENAVYHVMARGERREPIVFEHGSRELFLDTFAEAPGRTGDWRHNPVAWAVAKETSVPQEWIAERLNLKSAANASQQVRRFDQLPDRELVKQPEHLTPWKYGSEFRVSVFMKALLVIVSCLMLGACSDEAARSRIQAGIDQMRDGARSGNLYVNASVVGSKETNQFLAGLTGIHTVLINNVQSFSGLKLGELGSKIEVKDLQIMDSQMTDEYFEKLKEFRNVTKLYIANAPVSLRGISHFDKLAYLDIESTAAGDALCSELARMSSLRVLRLTGNQFSAVGFAKLIDGVTNLEDLSFAGGEIIPEPLVKQWKEAHPDCELDISDP
ncbi:MAG TPA: hypothetical protein VMN36_08200 [Verrucomicrobiales bacterium]|nr:hypothetical protein [Verrucomicrobiales bacterium]